MILTIEALHSSAASINDRERKPGMSADHDQLCPPLGQVVACRVVPIEDGHHALVADYDIFPDATQITLPSGEDGWEQESEKHRFPFTAAEFDHPSSSFCVSTDRTGVGGYPEVQAFFEELHAETDADFETQLSERRSLLPDPQIVFTLGIKASAAWLGLRMAKAAADALEPELKAFFKIVIAATKKMAMKAIPVNRPVTYVFQIHGTPNLELVARSRNADLVISAITGAKYADLKPQIDELRQRFQAEFVQFKMDDDGKWNFNFLLTNEGKVIGTKESFDRRAIVLKEMERQRIAPTHDTESA